MVAHLVRGIGEQEHHLFAARRDAGKAHRKAVAAEDRERDAHRAAAGLRPDVRGDLRHGGIVALGAGHDRFRHSNHVPVMGGDAVFTDGGQHTVDRDVNDVVPLADDGGAHAAHDRTEGSAHVNTPFLFK